MANILTPQEVRNYFKDASDEEINTFLSDGLLDLIVELEQEDYFGTEGFEKRFS